MRHDRAKARRIGVSEPPGLALITAAVTCDHICRHGPWAAGKTDQRLVRRELLADLPYGLVDGIKPSEIRRQIVKREILQRWTKERPFAGHEAQILSDRERDDEYVREKDRGVELGNRSSGWRVISAAQSGS